MTIAKLAATPRTKKAAGSVVKKRRSGKMARVKPVGSRKRPSKLKKGGVKKAGKTLHGPEKKNARVQLLKLEKQRETQVQRKQEAKATASYLRLNPTPKSDLQPSSLNPNP